MIEDSILKTAKPVFSGHETFPLRYGWLKKIYNASEDVERNNGSIIKDVFNNNDAISIFGVGKNMVTSMRYWGFYSGLLQQDKDFYINSFMKKILSDDGYDPWLENPASLWLVHRNLATNPNLFTYYWFFNHWNMSEFNKEQLVSDILEGLEVNSLSLPSISTLKRDVDCFLGVYSAKKTKGDAGEDSIESPLTELGLIVPQGTADFFLRKYGSKPSISSYTFIFYLLLFWDFFSKKAKTISVDAICYESHSPGRLLQIDEETICSYLQMIGSDTDGMIEWSETAGMKQIILNKEIDLARTAFDFFEMNYQ